MSDLLVILNPREIDECTRAFTELDIDRLWVRRMREVRIAERWPEILEIAHKYDNLILVSDDGIVRPHALQAVQKCLQRFPGNAATGYSNLAANDMRVNLSKAPLGPYPAPDAYTLMTFAEVMEFPEPYFRTWFAGMCLTGMRWEMWERYRFQVWNGAAQTDFSLSKRLEAADRHIIAVRDAFVWHVKDVWNMADTDPRKKPVDGPPEFALDRGGKIEVIG